MSPAGLLVLAKIKAAIPNNILAVKKSKEVKDLEHVVRLGNSDCFHTTKPKTRNISTLATSPKLTHHLYIYLTNSSRILQLIKQQNQSRTTKAILNFWRTQLKLDSSQSRSLLISLFSSIVNFCPIYINGDDSSDGDGDGEGGGGGAAAGADLGRHGRLGEDAEGGGVAGGRDRHGGRHARRAQVRGQLSHTLLLTGQGVISYQHVW